MFLTVSEQLFLASTDFEDMVCLRTRFMHTFFTYLVEFFSIIHLFIHHLYTVYFSYAFAFYSTVFVVAFCLVSVCSNLTQ